MEGEGSEAHLADYIWSLREAPGGGIPLFGPGRYSTHFLLPAFPTQLPYFKLTEQRMYPLRHAPTLERMTFPGHIDEEVSFSFLQFFILSRYLSEMMIILFPFQVVPIQMGELCSLYSHAWDNYSFLTHAVRDLVSHDKSYQQLLHSRVGVSSFGGSKSDQSNPSVAQVPPGNRPPRGPSRLGSGEQTPPPSDVEGSTSRRMRLE